jgi:hypothetical protein
MIAKKLSGVMGATVAIALVVVALWGWGESTALVRKADNPQLALWAVRSAAIAALAGAQVLGLTFVVGVFIGRRDRSGDMMRLAAGFVCTVALLGAIAMALLSR